jgi:hypothetical protein
MEDLGVEVSGLADDAETARREGQTVMFVAVGGQEGRVVAMAGDGSMTLPPSRKRRSASPWVPVPMWPWKTPAWRWSKATCAASSAPCLSPSTMQNIKQNLVFAIRLQRTRDVDCRGSPVSIF